ncbi:MAG: 2-hydroxyacid dehydrogenase [Marinomonas colpomeniae]
MIPFISRISAEEQTIWLEILSPMMNDEVIIPFSDLTEDEKLQCDVAIVANPDPEDLRALPNLKWVQSLWAGVEKMMQELSSPSFSVVRLATPDLSNTMSEAVLAWTLFLHRDMHIYAKQQSHKVWRQHSMVVAKDRRIGVLGLGALGKASAQRLVDNGFSVSGWSRNEKHIDNIECFYGEDGLACLLQKSDILICLLPLTNETNNLLNEQKLSYLPVGASIINFARGPIVDDAALLMKLEERHLSHAILDVFMQEPLPESHPYWVNENVTVLPHISAPTNPYSTSNIVVENINYYRKTGIIPPAVDSTQGY